MAPLSPQDPASVSSEAPHIPPPRAKACLWGHDTLKEEEDLLFQTMRAPWQWHEDPAGGPASDVERLRDLAAERPIRWDALRDAVRQASPRALAEFLRMPPSPIPAELLVRAELFGQTEGILNKSSGTEHRATGDLSPSVEEGQSLAAAQDAGQDPSPWGVWEALVARIADIQQAGPTALHPLTVLLWESPLLSLPRDRDGHLEPPDGTPGATGWGLTNTGTWGPGEASPRAGPWIGQVLALADDARDWIRARQRDADWTDVERRQLVALCATSVPMAHQVLPALPVLDVRWSARLLSAQPGLHPEALLWKEHPQTRPPRARTEGERGAVEHADVPVPLWKQQQRLEQVVRPGFFRWEGIVPPEVPAQPRAGIARGPSAETDQPERAWEERLAVLATLEACPPPRELAIQVRLALRLLAEAQERPAAIAKHPPAAEAPGGRAKPIAAAGVTRSGTVGQNAPAEAWWSIERERTDDEQQMLRYDPRSQTIPPPPEWERRLKWLSDWVAIHAPEGRGAEEERQIARTLELHLHPWLAQVDEASAETTPGDPSHSTARRPYTLQVCPRAQGGDAAHAVWRRMIERLVPVLGTSLGTEGRILAMRLLTGFPPNLSSARGRLSWVKEVELLSDTGLDPRLVWGYWQQRTESSLEAGVRLAPCLPPDALAEERSRLREAMLQRLEVLQQARLRRPQFAGALLEEASIYLGTPLRTLEEVRETLRAHRWDEQRPYLAMIQHPEAGLDPECRALLAKKDDPLVWGALVRRDPTAADVPDLIARFIITITHGPSQEADFAWKRLQGLESSNPDVLDTCLSLAALRALLLHPAQAIRLWAVRQIGRRSDREAPRAGETLTASHQGIS